MLSVHDAVFGSADLSLHILPPGGGGYRWMETIAIHHPTLTLLHRGHRRQEKPRDGLPSPARRGGIGRVPNGFHPYSGAYVHRGGGKTG
jgi:hypothetical protein